MSLSDRRERHAKKKLFLATALLAALFVAALSLWLFNERKVKEMTASLESLTDELASLEKEQTRETGISVLKTTEAPETTEKTRETAEETGETSAESGTRAAKDYDKILADDYRFQVVQSYRNIGVIINIANFLNIREAPNMEASIVGKGTPYAAFEIIGESGDWYQIEVNGLQGYVHRDYVASGEAGEIIAMENCNTDAYACGETSLYALPSTDSKVVATLDPSGHYIVLDTIGQWVKLLAYDTIVGYVKDEELGYRYSMNSPFFFTDSTGTVTLSKQRLDIISTAFNYYGGDYVWGGTDLETGVDCSGYVMRIYEKFGIYLPRTSAEQAEAGTAVASVSDAKPGDLLFFHGYHNGVKTEGVGHVAIYIGNGMMIHAASEARGIVTDSLSYIEAPLAIRRVIND